MPPTLPDELPPVNKRFASPEETVNRLSFMEQATDVIEDAGRVAEEMGPRHSRPDRTPETIPSVSAILIAMSVLHLADVLADIERRLPPPTE